MDLYQLGSSPTNTMNYKYITVLHNIINVHLQRDSSIFLWDLQPVGIISCHVSVDLNRFSVIYISVSQPCS